VIFAATLNVLEDCQQMLRFRRILPSADKQLDYRLLAFYARAPFANMSLAHLKLGFETRHGISSPHKRCIISQRPIRCIIRERKVARRFKTSDAAFAFREPANLAAVRYPGRAGPPLRFERLRPV
jgi:hypothetical protein